MATGCPKKMLLKEKLITSLRRVFFWDTWYMYSWQLRFFFFLPILKSFIIKEVSVHMCYCMMKISMDLFMFFFNRNTQVKENEAFLWLARYHLLPKMTLTIFLCIKMLKKSQEINSQRKVFWSHNIQVPSRQFENFCHYCTMFNS